MKHTNKRLLCLFLSLLLVASFLPIGISAEENSDELSDATIERVYDEVLTGNITDVEDVLDVALAQYESRTQSASTFSTRSADNPDEEENTLPMISQVLESTVSDDGTLTQLVADTGLYVTDSTGDTIYMDKLYNGTTASLSSYSIVATHTIYYYFRYNWNGLTWGDVVQVKAYKMTTKLRYDSVYTAALLEHYYCAPDATGMPARHLINSYTSPLEGALYTDYPSSSTTVEWLDAYTHPYPGFSSVAVVCYGSKSMEIVIDVHALNDGPENDGTW